MQYNGKNIWEDKPSSSDGYRRAYADGINEYIDICNKRAAEIRTEFMPPEKLMREPEKYRRKFIEMIGLDTFSNASSRNPEKIYVGSDDICSIYRITVYITDEIPFYAMLFMPHGAEKDAPLVIAQHGGGGTPELCADLNGKNNYNHMVQRVLKRGAAVIAPQLLLWSVKEQEFQRGHNIAYDRQKINNSLKRFGTSITALEIAGIRRCIDFGCEIPETDESKVSMIGLSYGGYYTMHTMAADTRIKAGYAAGFFNSRDVYDWHDWTYPSSAFKFQDAETAALCAPRKLYITVGKEDTVFDWKSAVSEFDRVKKYFCAFGAEDNIRFSLWEGGHTLPDDDEGIDFILSY
ncbi:MAG: alpha/beta hydrolase family protein [Monoglobaceae bacterium]